VSSDSRGIEVEPGRTVVFATSGRSEAKRGYGVVQSVRGDRVFLRDVHMDHGYFGEYVSIKNVYVVELPEVPSV
jgi:hypothetical protein